MCCFIQYIVLYASFCAPYDSLDVVEICMKIENEFDTSFDFNWVNDETTGSEIINYVNQTLANK